MQNLLKLNYAKTDRLPRLATIAALTPCPELFLKSQSVQRIVKSRRDYNTWVANETLEDYALRYTPTSFRK